MSLMEENWSEQTVKNALRANASKSAHCVVYPNTARTLTAEHDGSWCPDKGPNVVCYALQGNGIDRSDTAGCNDCGWRTEQMYTLNTIDRPAIAATIGSFMASNEGGGITDIDGKRLQRPSNRVL